MNILTTTSPAEARESLSRCLFPHLMPLGVGSVETLAWWHLTGSVSWVGERMMAALPPLASSHLQREKIRTRGPRHSWEVWSWQLPPGTMSWHWIVCNHPASYSSHYFSKSAYCQGLGNRQGLWMCKFGRTISESLNAFQLPRFWANCFASLFLESVRKKKSDQLNELVSISFA